jgi:hypothetical protein
MKKGATFVLLLPSDWANSLFLAYTHGDTFGH